MPGWLRRRRDERGAAAVIVGISMTLLLLIAGFAVDLGMQRVLRRDLQAMADVVALDMARHLDGRTQAVIKATPSWRGQLGESVLRNINDSSVSASMIDVKQLQEEAIADVDNGDLVATATMGLIDANGEFSKIPYPEVPSAVQVEIHSAVGFVFAGVTGISQGGAARSAVATTSSTACFRLGSFALGLDSENSALLNGLIGDAIDLGVLGYDGLANADLSLLGLATELGVGSVDELVSLPNLSMGELAIAAANVLEREGGETAQVDLLREIGLNVPTLPPIDLAGIIATSPGDDSALDANINVLDLIAGAAFLANGQNLLAVPNLTVGIPGIASVTAELRVIAAPQMYCGPINHTPPARNSQILLDLEVSLLDQGLSVLGLAGVRAATTLDLTVRIGDARGTLRKIICGDGTTGSPEGVDVSVATALTQIALALNIDVDAILLFIPVPVAEITAGVGTNEAPETSLAEVRVPPLDYETPLETGSGTVGLSGLAISDLQVQLLGIGGAVGNRLLDSILSGVLTPIVNPLISQIDSLLLGPLTDLLGLNVAGADVFIGDGADPPSRPECESPQLVG